GAERAGRPSLCLRLRDRIANANEKLSRSLLSSSIRLDPRQPQQTERPARHLGMTSFYRNRPGGMLKSAIEVPGLVEELRQIQLSEVFRQDEAQLATDAHHGLEVIDGAPEIL